MSTLELVRVRFLRPYTAYRPGQLVPVTRGLARTLELQRIATVEEQTPLEFAEAPQPQAVERAEAPVAKRRRKKHA